VTKVELIQCDSCKKDIRGEFSSYPNNTRYWECIPRFSKPDGIGYAINVKPNEPFDLCTDCFDKIRESLDLYPD